MATEDPVDDITRELDAIRAIVTVLRPLEPATQRSVLEYVIKKLDLKLLGALPELERDIRTNVEILREDARVSRTEEPADEGDQDDGGLADVNPIAQKWMKRSGLSAQQLSSLYSIGGDEIDLIARKVHGGSIKQRFRNVLLLKAVAAYLGSGAARVDHKSLKQAWRDYDADPGKNITAYMKDLAPEVSGSVASGYSLTSRGLAAATELVREHLRPAPAASNA